MFFCISDTCPGGMISSTRHATKTVGISNFLVDKNFVSTALKSKPYINLVNKIVHGLSN